MSMVMSSYLPSGKEQEMELPPYDEMLALLSKMAIEHGLQCPVTLSVNGSIICGDLISGSTYASRVAELMRSASGNVAPALEEAFLNLSESPENGPLVDPAYLCLDRVTVLTGGLVPTCGDQFVWRVRLDQVDGFAFGRPATQD